MQRTSDANTESIVKIKTKDIMLEQQIQEDIKAAMKAKVREIIAQVGATSIKDMGKVMGAANKALAGQSDGRTISAAVKELLS
jgi:uncharacterized protein YqeY